MGGWGVLSGGSILVRKTIMRHPLPTEENPEPTNVGPKRRQIWFCISKDGLRKSDRLGKGTFERFLNVSSDEVWRYVDFDFSFNNLFVLGPLVLRQGLKGVPIGGFLSAQLAELWCLWQEWLTLT